MFLDIKLLLVTDRDLLRLSRLVAIKIGKSELCQDAEGESILQRLAHGPANHAGKEHVVQLLDYFKLSGPNGTTYVWSPKHWGHGSDPKTCHPKLHGKCQSSS